MASSAPGILNWATASSLLQLNPASEVLPTQAECPQCRKPRLLVYCTTVRDTWHCCLECNFSGGLLDLFSAEWKKTKVETIQQLKSQGLIAEAEETRVLGNWERYDKRREWHQKFWQLASKNEVMARRYLHSYCTLTTTASPAMWKQNLSSVVGAIKGFSFETSRIRKLKGSQRPVVSLVLPFYSRPQQLCGFLTIRDKGNNTPPIYTATGGDISFYGMQRSSGFMALDTIKKSHSKKVVVLTEPVRCLSLQLRHAAMSNVPLPITSIFWDDSQRVRSREFDWHALADREVHHVCFEFTSQMLAMASWSGGKIHYTSVESPKDRRVWFNGRKPTELAEYIFENAKPWPEVFAKIAASLDDVSLLRMWNEAVILGMSKDCLLVLPPKLTQRISRLVDATAGTRVYTVAKGCRIVKRNSQFYVRMLKTRNEEEYLMLDADVRVRTLQQNGSDYLCRGELIHRGQAVAFTVKLKDWETDFNKWLRAFTVKHRLGYIYFAPAWGDRITRILMAFHPPVQATRSEVRQASAEPESSSCSPHPATIDLQREDQGIEAVDSPTEP